MFGLFLSFLFYPPILNSKLFLAAGSSADFGWKLVSMKSNTNNTQRIALILILSSTALSVLWGSFIAFHSAVGMEDFKAILYGSRCLIEHLDPYKSTDFLHAYLADGSKLPAEPNMADLFRRSVLVCVNVPTSLVLLIPFALLPVVPACVLWSSLMAIGLNLSAYLMWDLAKDKAPRLSLLLACIVISNAGLLFSFGNAACIVVSLSIVAVWCFLRDKFVSVGVLCLALSLAIKPHDAGLVWFYFLLAGGICRKRALQTLAVTAALCLPAVLWVSHVIPNWLPELQSNILSASAHGGLNDPGPTAIGYYNPDPMINLASFISVLVDAPRIYVPASYLISAALLLPWLFATVRTRFSQHRAWLGLASIAALSMLVTYHRQHDAKLLLLTVPACALLWEERSLVGRLAFFATFAAMLATADVPATALSALTAHLPLGTTLLTHLEVALLVRPAPILLLGLAAFYLGVYLHRCAQEQTSLAYDGSKAVWSREFETANNS